jgi:hypothetical protein
MTTDSGMTGCLKPWCAIFSNAQMGSSQWAILQDNPPPPVFGFSVFALQKVVYYMVAV